MVTFRLKADQAADRFSDFLKFRKMIFLSYHLLISS